MLFSVIIPSYNHANHLQKRIESVLNQSNVDFEVIIIDDASTDNSRTIIEEFRSHPRIKHIHFNETNTGSPFRSWQAGLKHAKGEWIWIAESDDFAENIFLQQAAAAIKLHPSIGIFYCDAYLKEEEKKPVENRFSAFKNKHFNTTKWSESHFVRGIEEITFCLGKECTVNNVSSAVLNRDLLEKCIDDTATFMHHGDWYTYLFIALRADLYYDAQPMNTYQHFSSNLSLPQNRINKVECFEILHFILPYVPKKMRTSLIRHFYVSYLQSGILSETETWFNYFRIDPILAIRILSLKM